MSADTPVAGYPVHAVASYTVWTNPHGARFTDWTATCGVGATDSGAHPFARAGQARRAELCPVCFPTGHNTYIPDPVQQ